MSSDIVDLILHKITYLCNAFCPYSLMDRITDSGSVGCGSIPHGGTKKDFNRSLFLIYVCCLF